MRIGIASIGALIVVFTLAACGGGDGGGDPPSELGTLAYVETECRATSEGFYERQALRIRRGDREPVTVFETPGVGPLPGRGYLCWALIQGRGFARSITRDAFQWVAVSPEGASVVFEVTDEFSVAPPLPLNLAPEQKGVFWVRADGSGLRRLGPPSRVRLFDLLPSGVLIDYSSGLPVSFSPDGRTIVFVDKGPDEDGHEADQIVTIDVATGTRTQVTRLRRAAPPAGYTVNAPTIYGPLFIDERTVSFYASVNPNGLNPKGIYLPMSTRVDGSGLDVPLPISVALGGSTIELRFVISGDRPQAILAIVPGEPTNDPRLDGFFQEIYELFVIDEGRNILQLTDFRRQDTWYALADVDREQVYFSASADPLGTNPTENCQLFSIDRLGSNLRQLTNFREIDHSVVGCGINRLGLGCSVYGPFWQDQRSRAVLFNSNCDPFGTNPNGSQVFSIQPDGSGLRQLTNSRDLVFQADAFIGELPGPWAYGPYPR